MYMREFGKYSDDTRLGLEVCLKIIAFLPKRFLIVNPCLKTV